MFDKQNKCICKDPKRINIPKGNYHPSVKPLKLFCYLIALGVNLKKKNLILDPFLGSGTCALAAKILNQHYIGVEMNKEYYDIAVQRVKPHVVLEFKKTMKDLPNKKSYMQDLTDIVLVKYLGR